MIMKKFIVYVGVCDSVFKIAVPAKDENEARDMVQGTGEVIAIKDVTSDYNISAVDVIDALRSADMNKFKIDFIVRALDEIVIISY